MLSQCHDYEWEKQRFLKSWASEVLACELENMGVQYMQCLYWWYWSFFFFIKLAKLHEQNATVL